MTALLSRVTSSPRWRATEAELRENPRLRWMLFAGFAIFLLYLALVVDDWRKAAVEDFRPLAVREARLEELAANTEVDFQAFFEREKAANAALMQRFWRSSSRGLAGAELQAWLREIARNNNLRKLRLDLSEGRPVPGLDEPVWRLEAELSGELTPSDARALVADLARSERSVDVERLNFSPQRGDRLTLQLVAYFIIAPVEEAGK